MPVTASNTRVRGDDPSQLDFTRLFVASQAALHGFPTILSDTMELPNVSLIEQEAGVRALWHRLAAIASASPKVWMDAYLAAFAIRHAVEFVTLDKDFKNFVKDGLVLRLLAP